MGGGEGGGKIEEIVEGFMIEKEWVWGLVKLCLVVRN